MVAFQPHLFSRTRDFADGFAESLAAADELLLLDIYPARELQKDFEGITSDWLLEKSKVREKRSVQFERKLLTKSKKKILIFCLQ